jgi:mono/diheme cytochrome c family protein
MYRQPSVKAQELDPNAPNGVGMRQPVKGTVPRDFEPYRFGFADSLEAKKLRNPLTPTKDVLAAGKKYYETYCIVCHGAKGDGYGYIVPKFTMPPSLYSEKLRGWTDGLIYHTISIGQGLMPSYATQIQPEQRWVVVHYVRALQRAAYPTPEDLQAMKGSAIGFDTDLPDTGKVQIWPKK